jgi:hypothetical protein
VNAPSDMKADDSTSSSSRVFPEPGEIVPFEMPVLLFGIDLTDITEAFHEQAQEFFKTKGSASLPPFGENPINRGLKQRP